MILMLSIWTILGIATGPGGWLSYVAEEDYWAKDENRPSIVQKTIVMILAGPCGWITILGYSIFMIFRMIVYPLLHILWSAIGNKN